MWLCFRSDLIAKNIHIFFKILIGSEGLQQCIAICQKARTCFVCFIGNIEQTLKKNVDLKKKKKKETGKYEKFLNHSFYPSLGQLVSYVPTTGLKFWWHANQAWTILNLEKVVVEVFGVRKQFVFHASKSWHIHSIPPSCPPPTSSSEILQLLRVLHSSCFS